MTDPKIEDVLFVTEDQPRFRPGYGRRWYEQQDDRHAPMYRFTHLGLDALERHNKQVTA